MAVVARAQHAAVVAHVERARAELDACGVGEPNETRAEQALAAAQTAQAALRGVEAEARDLGARAALAKERRQGALERRDQARLWLERLVNELAPVEIRIQVHFWSAEHPVCAMMSHGVPLGVASGGDASCGGASGRPASGSGSRK